MCIFLCFRVCVCVCVCVCLRVFLQVSEPMLQRMTIQEYTEYSELAKTVVLENQDDEDLTGLFDDIA